MQDDGPGTDVVCPNGHLFTIEGGSGPPMDADEDADGYESPQRPGGNPAVVVLSDGARLILADGTVCRIEVRDHKSGDRVPCINASEGVYGYNGDGTRVEVSLPTDDEATDHPLVRAALGKLGFLEPAGADPDLDWEYAGVTSFVNGTEHPEHEPGGLVVTHVNAYQIHQAPSLVDGPVHRLVQLTEDRLVGPASGGLPDFGAHNWHGFERVGLVTDYKDAGVLGAVMAEPEWPDDEPGPEWYWVEVGEAAVDRAWDRDDGDHSPVDLNVYVDAEEGSQEQLERAEGIRAWLDNHQWVDRVTNCAETRAETEEDDA